MWCPLDSKVGEHSSNNCCIVDGTFNYIAFMRFINHQKWRQHGPHIVSMATISKSLFRLGQFQPLYWSFTSICRGNHPNVGKYTSTMEHMGVLRRQIHYRYYRLLVFLHRLTREHHPFLAGHWPSIDQNRRTPWSCKALDRLRFSKTT